MYPYPPSAARYCIAALRLAVGRRVKGMAMATNWENVRIDPVLLASIRKLAEAEGIIPRDWIEARLRPAVEAEAMRMVNSRFRTIKDAER